MYILARAPRGQMQGAATQAMLRHRRGAATQQRFASRRAPSGCGPQARRLRCSRLASWPRDPQQNAHVIHAQTLNTHSPQSLAELL